ncbi:hypothetical protein A4A49_62260, partial [Nicotiana attenuata]
ILMKSVEPTLNQAYALVVEDESQRSTSGTSHTGLNSIAEGNDITALWSSAARGGSVHKNKRNFSIYCDFCKMKGHSKENYYQLVGYPADFKGRRKPVQGNTGGHQHQRANAAYHGDFSKAGGYCNAGQTEAQPQISGGGVTITFTPEQYNQILQILNKENVSEISANIAGTICSFLASKIGHNWIV